MIKDTTDQKRFVAPVKIGDALLLEPAPNGGWVVSARPIEGAFKARVVGAFSSGADMLDALSGLADWVAS